LNPFYNREGTKDEFLPGSRILLCTLVTEDFAAALGVSEAEMRNNNLTDAQLLDLLEPLRKAYGDFDDPTAVYLTPWHVNVDTAYGSYTNWQVGKSVKDYFHFFGALNENLVEACDHNGCDGDDWIVHLSGTTSCFDGTSRLSLLQYPFISVM
jgi:hypothetical protein